MQKRPNRLDRGVWYAKLPAALGRRRASPHGQACSRSAGNLRARRARTGAGARLSSSRASGAQSRVSEDRRLRQDRLFLSRGIGSWSELRRVIQSRFFVGLASESAASETRSSSAAERRTLPLRRNAMAPRPIGGGHFTGVQVHKENRISVLGCRLNCLQGHRDNSGWVLGHSLFLMTQPSSVVCRSRT